MQPCLLRTSSPITVHGAPPSLMSCSGRQGKRGPRPRRRYQPQRWVVFHPQRRACPPLAPLGGRRFGKRAQLTGIINQLG